MAANVENMMYVTSEGKPWHGLGVGVSSAVSSTQALEIAGLANWNLCKQALITETGIPVPGKYAVVRQDREDRNVLGVVGERYTPLENEEAFAFCDALVGGEQNIRYHTAGSLGCGERIWMLAKIGESVEVVKNDVVEQYLLFTNSHDGSGSIRALFTPTRVVCQNTLNAALSKGDGVKLRHTKTVRERLEQTRKVLGFAHRITQRYAELAETMVRQPMGQAEFSDFYLSLFPLPSATEGVPMRNWEFRKELIENLFDEGVGQDIPGVHGTKWAALNAITEYTSHYVEFRAEKEQEQEESHVQLAEGYSRWSDARLSSLIDGKIANLHQQAVYVLTM